MHHNNGICCFSLKLFFLQKYIYANDGIMCWGRVNWVQKNQKARANKLSSGTQNTMKSLDYFHVSAFCTSQNKVWSAFLDQVKGIF